MSSPVIINNNTPSPNSTQPKTYMKNEHTLKPRISEINSEIRKFGTITTTAGNSESKNTKYVFVPQSMLRTNISNLTRGGLSSQQRIAIVQQDSTKKVFSLLKSNIKKEDSLNKQDLAIVSSASVNEKVEKIKNEIKVEIKEEFSPPSELPTTENQQQQQQDTKYKQESIKWEKESIEENNEIRRKHCNCTKSQCLKLYCDCFANGEFCQDCNCKDCFNNLQYEDERQKAIRNCLERNPSAFK